jgi:putative PIN family toxin of toxin-antitoxin system
MRLVVDTNVLVRAAFKELSWPGLVVRWVDKFDGLLKTPATEQEFFDVVQIPRIAENTVPLFAARLLQILAAAAELVTTTKRVAACRDPKDDKFLELVVNGHADLIISGDADLQVLDTFRRSPIITPAAFGHAHLRYPLILWTSPRKKRIRTGRTLS